jgi:hypothetical protein
MLLFHGIKVPDEFDNSIGVNCVVREINSAPLVAI